MSVVTSRLSGLPSGETMDDLRKGSTVSFVLDQGHGERLLQRSARVSQLARPRIEHQIGCTVVSSCNLHPARFAKRLGLRLIIEPEGLHEISQRAILHGGAGPKPRPQGQQGVLPNVVKMYLGHAGHRVRDSARSHDAEELGKVVLSDSNGAWRP